MKKTKTSALAVVWEFVKLQLAGNVLFWVTYLGSACLLELMHWPSLPALALASIVAHILFFVIDKKWVFSTKTGKKKTSNEIRRFIVFMGGNYFLSLGLILGLETYFGISPYVGQFISAFLFSIWTWLGLRFWVFRHVRHAHHAGLTIETKDAHARRHRTYKRLETKQKAKRAA